MISGDDWDQGPSLIRRLVFGVGLLLALTVAAGIVLVITAAAPNNPTALRLIAAARWLAGPFRHVFPRNDFKQDVALNWGLAGGIYFLTGLVLSRTLTSR